MSKVSFHGLLTDYSVRPLSPVSTFGRASLEWIIQDADMMELAKFLNPCLDQSRTSEDKFTITLEKNDDE